MGSGLIFETITGKLLTRKKEMNSKKGRETLSRVYAAVRSSQCLPLLFSRGPGELKESNKRDKVPNNKSEKKSKSKPRKRCKFGDDDDEVFIPKGARRTAYREYNKETKKWEWIPPPVY